jgi:hypothetical protein
MKAQRQLSALPLDGKRPDVRKSALGRGDRRDRRNSSPLGVVHSALLGTEFGGRGLGSADPIVDNRHRRAGSGSARAAARWGIRQAFALYATEPLQREVNKVVNCTTNDCIGSLSERSDRFRHSGPCAARANALAKEAESVDRRLMPASRKRRHNTRCVEVTTGFPIRASRASITR